MTNTTPCISAIILAGGEGKRVGGQDKGLLKLNNRTYIEHVIDRIKNQVDDITISANRNIETYKNFCPQVISDTADTYLGPLSGISSCLPACKHEWVLVVPCDMPYLPDDLASRLYTGITTENIAIATVDGKHQLVLLLKKSLHHSLLENLQNNHLKLIQWVESQNFLAIDFNTQGAAFHNLNTA